MFNKTVVQLPFGRPETTVPAATERLIEDNAPVIGQLLSITLHFPDGCNALVEITCFLKGNQVLPVNGVIALNNSTSDFQINRKVNKGDIIKARISNRDSVNSHTPSIIFNFEGEQSL